MSTMDFPHPMGASRERRMRALLASLRRSLTKAADSPLELSHTERAVRLAQALRAELLAGEHHR